jgi:hypothetical protein
VTVSQLDELASLRSEVEGIDREARLAAPESAGHAAALSYSIGVWSSAEDNLVAIVESIKETLAKLTPVASFETSRDGFTARTVINYSGQAVSVWSSGTTLDLADAHLESLQGAYAFRASVVRVIAAVGNAVVAISIAVANPLTVWHAVKSAEALKPAVDRLAAAVAANEPSPQP